MMKIIKLIYLNILGLFDINKIVVARSRGVVSSSEKKVVITTIISLLYGYIIYVIFSKIKFSNVFDILNVGFVVSSLFCLIISIQNVNSILFKNTDNDYLFSLPLTRNEIIFSKLFTIYVKNLLYVVIFMFAFLLAFGHQGGNINETLVLMYLIMGLFVPGIPIVIATIIALGFVFLKTKLNNGLLFNFVKLLFILVVLVLLYFVFKNVDILQENFINSLFLKIENIYFIVYFFNMAISKVSLLGLILYILVNVLVVYLYVKLISYNYVKICSLLRGVITRKKFVYHKSFNFRQLGGLVRKELINLFNNKQYLVSSFGNNFLISLLLLLFMFFIGSDKLLSLENFDHYFKLFVPNILSAFAAFGGFGICAMSLESRNLECIYSMPIRMEKVIFAKWLTNVLIDLIFVVVNGCVVMYNFELSNGLKIMIFLLPLVTVMYISLLSIILDYRYIAKEENTITDIIQSRLINLIPTCTVILIAIGPLFFVNFLTYEVTWLTFLFVLLVGLFCLIIYLIIFRKKLLYNAFN